jgi:hypothetical protein
MIIVLTAGEGTRMNIEDTGLSPLWLQDLVLKVMYFQGYLTGYKVAEEVALPFSALSTRSWRR